jgi:hypothetical protein
MIKHIDNEGRVTDQKEVEVLTLNGIGSEISYFLIEKNITLKNEETIELEILDYR